MQGLELKHPSHHCPYNDTLPGCACYSEGYREGVERAVKEMTLEKRKCDFGGEDDCVCPEPRGFNSAVKELQERGAVLLKSLEKGE